MTENCIRIVWTIVLLHQIACYSTGPPELACNHGTPLHRPHLPVDRAELCPYLVNFTSFTPGVPHACKYSNYIL